MNELDGDIRRFLTRLTDAAPDAPAAGTLADHRPSSPGRPVARLVGALAVLSLVVVGAVALRQRDGAPSAGQEAATTTRATAPAVLCALVPKTMPNVVGLAIADARAQLARPCNEIPVDVYEVPSADAAVGVVLTQSVPAGATVPSDASVALEIASPSPDGNPCTLEASRVVPSVVGMTADQARKILGVPCLGFTVAAEEVTDPSRPPGVVLSQDPAGGVLATPGTEVRLSIAAGRTPDRGFQVIGTFDLDTSRRVVELQPGGICISRGDDATRGCDGLPGSLSPVVVFFGGSDDPQEMWGLLDAGLTIRVERDGVAVSVQQTTEPVGGHLAFFGLVPAGGRVTISVVDASGAMVKRLDGPPR